MQELKFPLTMKLTECYLASHFLKLTFELSKDCFEDKMEIKESTMEERWNKNMFNNKPLKVYKGEDLEEISKMFPFTIIPFGSQDCNI